MENKKIAIGISIVFVLIIIAVLYYLGVIPAAGNNKKSPSKTEDAKSDEVSELIEEINSAQEG